MQKPAPQGRLVAIGNFDGVHLGHQALLAGAARDAAERGLEPLVLTFEPHPAEVIGRGAPPLLTPLARKIELIQRAQPGVRVVVEPFDRAFAAQTPEAFAEGILVSRLAAKLVIVGRNFRFGRARAGDFDALAELGTRLGFETRSHALVGDAGGTFSSTRARQAIAAGDLDAARAILGRPHALTGVVVRGDQRGRTLGFPTANLAGCREALPPFGVYAVAVDRVEEATEPGPARDVRQSLPLDVRQSLPLDVRQSLPLDVRQSLPLDVRQSSPHSSRLAAGVANIGVRPTVKEGAPPTVEVNLFDLDADLYGARLRVHLLARLRGEQRFAGLDALRAQIAKDAAAARAVTDALPRPPAGQPWW